MKKWVALVLTVVLLLGICGSSFAAMKYDTLTVGTTTPFTGNFFSDVFGHNIADIDVQKLVHGCSPVYWNPTDGAFLYNSSVISGNRYMDDPAGNRTYYLALYDDLYFSNGERITAWDYAFSLLLLCSGQMAEISGNTSIKPEISGCENYRNGETNVLRGVHVYSDAQLSITIDADYRPYYYEVAVLDIVPYPISVIAPGCTVKDDGDGVYLDGKLTAEALNKKLTNDRDGYISHPSVSSGPYTMASYKDGIVTLQMNLYFKGNHDAQKPKINNIVYRCCNNEDMLQELVTGKVDFLSRCTRKEIIDRGMELVEQGEFLMDSYPRSGYSFFSFCCEKDTVSDIEVRKAIAMCIDKDAIVEAYVGDYGLRVDGDYGIGQWMYQKTASEADEEETEEETTPAPAGSPAQILEQAGWIRDEDGIRYKMIDDRKVRLELKVIYPEGNMIGELLQDNMINPLHRNGILLTAEAVPMAELLNYYYRFAERDCDMIYLATNFGMVYDPTSNFDPKENDTVSNTTGLKDQKLYDLALAMRQTKPGEVETYTERWKAYQERWTEMIPLIPVYSNLYYDFFVPALQDYHGDSEYGWAEAILGAYLGDRSE